MMARKPGTQNKLKTPPPKTVLLTTEDRIAYLANMIVDRIQEDQLRDSTLLAKLTEGSS